jgi:NAD(P)-dependent dehydrogenase (short-subunit alcohol dehydrogenase family)
VTVGRYASTVAIEEVGMGKLDGKVAVITGAASGIGAATARSFAREGAALVLADLNEEGGERIAAECRSAGARAVFQRADVAAEADVAAMIERAVREHGGLHVLFNNAGLGGALGPIEQTSVEDWDRTQAILLRSVFLGMKHAIPPMRKAGGGSILSTASVAGLRGGAGPHCYSAAKAAVVNLTRSVALEVAKDSIRVNCICPGGINTPLIYERIGGEEIAGQLLQALQPLPRAGRSEDIAAMALFLASDDSVFVTGAAMVVDGGFTAGGSLLQREGPVQIEPGFSGPSFQYPRG